jgi:hypothetical protein
MHLFLFFHGDTGTLASIDYRNCGNVDRGVRKVTPDGNVLTELELEDIEWNITKALICKLCNLISS